MAKKSKPSHFTKHGRNNHIHRNPLSARVRELEQELAKVRAERDKWRDALDLWVEYSTMPCNECEHYRCEYRDKGDCVAFNGYIDCMKASHTDLSTPQPPSKPPSKPITKGASNNTPVDDIEP